MNRNQTCKYLALFTLPTLVACGALNEREYSNLDNELNIGARAHTSVTSLDSPVVGPDDISELKREPARVRAVNCPDRYAALQVKGCEVRKFYFASNLQCLSYRVGTNVWVVKGRTRPLSGGARNVLGLYVKREYAQGRLANLGQMHKFKGRVVSQNCVDHVQVLRERCAADYRMNAEQCTVYTPSKGYQFKCEHTFAPGNDVAIYAETPAQYDARGCYFVPEFAAYKL
jgi:hypothetical protein